MLVVVAIRMGEWHQFASPRRWPKSDAAVFACAFVLTVITELPVAVGVTGAGLGVAGEAIVRDHGPRRRGRSLRRTRPGKPRQVERFPQASWCSGFWRVLFFWRGGQIETSLRRAGQLPDVLILRMRDVTAMDATGIDALEDLFEKLRKHGKNLILCGPTPAIFLHSRDPDSGQDRHGQCLWRHGCNIGARAAVVGSQEREGLKNWSGRGDLNSRPLAPKQAR